MSNAENFSSDGLNVTYPKPYTYGSWILTEMFMILSTAVYVYVLFRLVIDELARGKVSRQFEGSKPKTRKAVGARLHRICIVSAVLDLLYVICTQTYLATFWLSSLVCSVTVLLSATIYSMSLLGTFTFLWCRQRALYGNPVLKHLSTKFNHVLSWISIVGIYLTILVPTCSMLVWRRYEITAQGCKLKVDLLATFQKWYIFYTISYFANQLLLLWLYVHPLLEHKRRKEILANGRRESCPSTTSQNIQEAKFRQCIVRSVKIAVCCVVNDIVAAIAVTLVSRTNQHRWTMLIAHCMNLNINLLCMVGCFVYWRDLLCPCAPEQGECEDATNV